MSEHKVKQVTGQDATTVYDVKPSRGIGRFKWLIVAVVVLGLLAAGTGYYIHTHHKPDPNAATRAVLLKQADSTISVSGDAQSKAQAYMEKANIYITNNDYKNAVATYRQALQLTPHSITVNAALCNSYFYLHDKKNTVAYCQKAIDLTRKDASSPYKSNISIWQGLLNQAKAGNFKVRTGTP